MALGPLQNMADPTTGGGAFPGTTTTPETTLSGIAGVLRTVPVAVARNAHPGPLKTGYVPVFQTATIDDAILQFDKASPAGKAQIQNSLFLAGYYGDHPPTIVPGEVNDADRAAYRNAVEDAARQTGYGPNHVIIHPVSVAQVITDRISARQKQGIPPVAPGQSRQVQLTNPDDIRAAVLASAQQLYGRKADPGLVDHIINRYRMLEQQAAASTAPTITAPPSVSSFAQAQVQAANPMAVGVHSGLGIADAIMRMFQAPAGSGGI